MLLAQFIHSLGLSARIVVHLRSSSRRQSSGFGIDGWHLRSVLHELLLSTNSRSFTLLHVGVQALVKRCAMPAPRDHCERAIAQRRCTLWGLRLLQLPHLLLPHLIPLILPLQKIVQTRPVHTTDGRAHAALGCLRHVESRLLFVWWRLGQAVKHIFPEVCLGGHHVLGYLVCSWVELLLLFKNLSPRTNNAKNLLQGEIC
mmetsp:Transcript_892/g.1797  ORF Transcript_892/g.1797 Transcript_892/m.1797 type:complete len:201 (-) Transcript_892:997-1599(-)